MNEIFSYDLGNETEINRLDLITKMIQEFDQIYPSEKDCQEKINRMLYPDGKYPCKDCKSTNVKSEYGDRNVDCLDCKKTTSITTHTFFQRIRSARSYLAPIWMMEQGMLLNASEIARISEVVNSTGQHILKKIAYIVKERMKDLDSFITSEQMIGTICKRSKETPKRLPPVAEIIDAKSGALGWTQSKDNPEEASKSESLEKNIDTMGSYNGLIGSEVEKSIVNLLTDEPVRLEFIKTSLNIPESLLLPALSMLELNEMVDRLPGDLYRINCLYSIHSGEQKDKNKTDEAIKTRIDKFNREDNDTSENRENSNDEKQDTMIFFSKSKLKKTIKLIKQRYHGISRKYLQFYFALIWVSTERGLWQKDNLLKFCCHSGDVAPFQIYEYVSPFSVLGLPVK